LVPWWLGGLAVCQIVAKNNRRNPDAGVEGGAPARKTSKARKVPGVLKAAARQEAGREARPATPEGGRAPLLPYSLEK